MNVTLKEIKKILNDTIDDFNVAYTSFLNVVNGDSEKSDILAALIEFELSPFRVNHYKVSKEIYSIIGDNTTKKDLKKFIKEKISSLTEDDDYFKNNQERDLYKDFYYMCFTDDED